MWYLLFALVAFLCPLTAPAHVTMEPSFGAVTGDYFSTSVKVPHGLKDHWTSKLEITLPDGILTVKPEQKHGWAVGIETRSIEPYWSHGREVATGPSKVTFTAEAVENSLHNDHMLRLELQTKIGCSFNDAHLNTIWQDQHTLWFPVKQFMSTQGTLDHAVLTDWKAIPAENGSPWGSTGNKPAPFVFVYAGEKCGNTTWLGTKIPPAKNKAVVRNEEHVISILEDNILTILEKAGAEGGGSVSNTVMISLMLVMFIVSFAGVTLGVLNFYSSMNRIRRLNSIHDCECRRKLNSNCCTTTIDLVEIK